MAKLHKRKTAIDRAIVDAERYSIGDASFDDLGALTEANAFRSEFAQPYAGRASEQLGLPAFDLVEWDLATRRDILKRCHQAWERNPLAHTAVSYTRRFAVGTGLKVAYKSEAVKEIVQEFLTGKDNDIPAREKEVCDALQVDGEVFYRFHEKNGKTRLSVIQPWKVADIETDEDNVNVKIAYCLADDTRVPADDILHLAINRMPYEKRGRPELFRVFPWLKAYKDWLEERVRRNKWANAFYFDVTLKNATAAQIANRRSKLAEPPSPASIVVHNDNEVWQTLASNVGASEVSEDGRQLKLMIAAGLEIPEFMLSDGSMSNLATATAQSFPPLLKFQDFQDTLQTAQVTIIKRVIQNAVDAGLLSEEVEEVDADGDVILDDEGAPRMVKSVDAFDANYPKITQEDIVKLTQALQIQLAAGLVDEETAMTDLGHDPAVIKKRLAQQAAEQAMEPQPEVDQFGNPIDPNAPVGGQQDQSVQQGTIKAGMGTDAQPAKESVSEGRPFPLKLVIKKS